MSTRAKTWIALLRGVNVGGKNKLPMKELAAEIGALGFVDVRTYIQSGNVVFRDSLPARSALEISTSIAGSIHSKFGFQPGVVVISKEELVAAARANPFPKAEQEADGKALHLFFLGEHLNEHPRNVDQAALNRVKLPSERWRVSGSVFYLHAPEGFGNSKLAAKVERCVGVPATARNWRTVCELLKLADVPAD